MNNFTSDFSLEIDGVSGVSPGEKWAKENIRLKAIPVLSCEGSCIRGEIARLAADIVAAKESYARACYAEAALVPHSSTLKWVKEAERVVIIDGCNLNCIARVMNNLVQRDRIVHIDAHQLYQKYSDVFLATDVPETARKETANHVAGRILDMLKEEAEAEHRHPA